MMFKKFRKYLIVLMAIVMLASFAVVQTAALDGDTFGDLPDEGIYPSGSYWIKQVHTWAIDSTMSNRFHTWTRVVYSGGAPCDYDPDNFEVGIRMGYSDAYSILCLTYAMASTFSGSGGYGFGWI